MANEDEPSPRAQRHRELWETRNARLAQLLFATLLFGALATWRVARPAAAQAVEHRTSSLRLAESNGTLARLGEERGEIERVVKGLAAAQATIASNPWKGILAELKQGFVALNKAERWFRNDPKGTRDHFVAGASAGSGERDSGEARPISDQSAPTNQFPPEANAPALLPSPEDDARANRLAALAPIVIDRDAAAAAADARAFDRLWVDAMSRAVQEHVTTKVATIVALSHEQVEGPVAAALREAPQLDARAPKLRAATSELSQQLEQWRASHRDESSWYSTIQGKDDAFGQVEGMVRRWSQQIAPELATAQEQLATDLAAAQERVGSLEKEQAELRGRKLELEAQLQELLPEWIRGFFTSAELVRFLPFALTLLGAAIAVGARLVRHHHRACRDELFPDPAARRDPAVSSCWTLVDRGAAGTLWSSLCFVAATVGWWLATDAALQCAAESWDDPFFGAPPFAAAWLFVPRAALFALPALAAVGIAAAWRDRRGADAKTIASLSIVLALALPFVATSCNEESGARAPVLPPTTTATAGAPRMCDVTDDGPPWPLDPPPFEGERFTWMRDAVGTWRHASSASPRYRMQEIVTGGVALLDVDGDGDQDLFCNTGGAWPDQPPPATKPQHALFRNDGGWRFTEIAAAAGVTLPEGGYAIGATAADFDGDGDDDLYVTGDRRSWLYRNDGVAAGAGDAGEKVPRFVECAAELGVDAAGLLASSAAFLDADRDGRLDLYVVGYVAFTDEQNERLRCGESITGVRDYCSPKDFSGTQDLFFRQQEDGRFREEAVERGLVVPAPLASNGKGLGVVAADVDDDGDVDLYVANDGCPNLLFLNDGAGHFAEKGMVRGCALSADGRSQAGMGTDAGDCDGDGDVDLVVTNLDLESNDLYRNDGAGFFEDDARGAGLAAQDDGAVGFGALFLDWDHDGDQDLAIANGHVMRHVHRTRGTLTCWQRDQLFENDGRGRYRLLAPSEAGAYYVTRNLARGLVAGDLDGDGDLDLVVARRDDGPALLRNTHAERTGRADALLLTLRGAAGNRDAIGAVARLTAGGATQLRLVKGGGSYASASDRRLHFALPAGTRDATLTVRWPDGTQADFGPVEAGFAFRATQGGALEKVGPLVTR